MDGGRDGDGAALDARALPLGAAMVATKPPTPHPVTAEFG